MFNLLTYVPQVDNHTTLLPPESTFALEALNSFLLDEVKLVRLILSHTTISPVSLARGRT